MAEQTAIPSKEDSEYLLSMAMKALGSIVDLRQESKVRYPIRDIVLLVVAAVCARAASWFEIQMFGESHFDELHEYLQIKAVPSHDTIQRVMSMISPDVLLRIYVLWCSCMDFEEETPESLKGLRLLNIDGKTIRGSGGRGKKPVHIESLWDPQKGMCVNQTAVDEKTNEIRAIPIVLGDIDLTGCIVTSDAMGTQTAIAKQIRDQNGEYVLALKGNHAALYEDLKEYAADEELLQEIRSHGGYKCTREKAHGQIEIREYWQTADIGWIADRGKWAGLATIGFERTTIKKAGKTSVSWRFFISSLPEDIEVFACAVRGHWRIEAMHNVLDTTLKEDENRTLNRTAAENLSIIRKWIYSILRHMDIGKPNASMRAKSFYVSQNPQAALSLLVSASR